MMRARIRNYRSHPSFVDVATLVGATLLVSCSGIDQSRSDALPTWSPEPNEVFTLARGGPGSLELDAGCYVVVEESGEMLLPVWPKGARVDGSTLIVLTIDNPRTVTLRQGDVVTLQGNPDPTVAEWECPGLPFVVNDVRVLAD